MASATMPPSVDMGPEFAPRLAYSTTCLIFSLALTILTARKFNCALWCQILAAAIVFSLTSGALAFLVPRPDATKLAFGLLAYLEGFVSSVLGPSTTCNLHSSELNVFRRFRQDDFTTEMECLGRFYGSEFFTAILPGYINPGMWPLRSTISNLFYSITSEFQMAWYFFAGILSWVLGSLASTLSALTERTSFITSSLPRYCSNAASVGLWIYHAFLEALASIPPSIANGTNLVVNKAGGIADSFFELGRGLIQFCVRYGVLIRDGVTGFLQSLYGLLAAVATYATSVCSGFFVAVDNFHQRWVTSKVYAAAILFGLKDIIFNLFGKFLEAFQNTSIPNHPVPEVSVPPSSRPQVSTPAPSFPRFAIPKLQASGYADMQNRGFLPFVALTLILLSLPYAWRLLLRSISFASQVRNDHWPALHRNFTLVSRTLTEVLAEFTCQLWPASLAILQTFLAELSFGIANVFSTIVNFVAQNISSGLTATANVFLGMRNFIVRTMNDLLGLLDFHGLSSGMLLNWAFYLSAIFQMVTGPLRWLLGPLFAAKAALATYMDVQRATAEASRQMTALQRLTADLEAAQENTRRAEEHAMRLENDRDQIERELEASRQAEQSAEEARRDAERARQICEEEKAFRQRSNERELHRLKEQVGVFERMRGDLPPPVQLKAQLDTANNLVNDLKGRLDKSNNYNKELENDNEQLEQRRQTAKAALARASLSAESVQFLKDENQRLSNAREKCEKHGRELIKKVTGLEADIIAHKEKEKQLQLTKNAVSNKANADSERCEYELDRHRKREDELTKQIKNLEAQMSGYDEDDKRAVNQLWNTKQNLDQTKRRENDLKDDNRKLQARLDELEKLPDTQEVTEKLDACNKSLQMAREELDRTQKQLENANSKEGEFKDQVARLEKQVGESQSRDVNNAPQISHLQEQLDVSRASEDQLKDMVSKLQQNGDGYQAEIAQLKDMFSKLQQTGDGYQAEIAQLKQGEADYQAEISRLKQSGDDYQAEVARLQQVLALGASSQEANNAYKDELERKMVIIDNVEKVRKEANGYFGLPENTDLSDILRNLQERLNTNVSELHTAKEESQGYKTHAEKVTSAVQTAATNLGFDSNQGLDTFLANIAPAEQVRQLQQEVQQVQGQLQSASDAYQSLAKNLGLNPENPDLTELREKIENSEKLQEKLDETNLSLEFAQSCYNDIIDHLRLDPEHPNIEGFLARQVDPVDFAKAETKLAEYKAKYDLLYDKHQEVLKYWDFIDDTNASSAEIINAILLRQELRDNEERGNEERGNEERGNVERGNVERENVEGDNDDEKNQLQARLNFLLGLHKELADGDEEEDEEELYDNIKAEVKKLKSIAETRSGNSDLTRTLIGAIQLELPADAPASDLISALRGMRDGLHMSRRRIEQMRVEYYRWHLLFAGKAVARGYENDIEKFWTGIATAHRNLLEQVKQAKVEFEKIKAELNDVKRKLEECEKHRRQDEGMDVEMAAGDGKRGSISQILPGTGAWERMQEGRPGSTTPTPPVFGSGANTPFNFNLVNTGPFSFHPSTMTSAHPSGASTPAVSRDDLLTKISSREQLLRNQQREHAFQPWDDNQGIRFENLRRQAVMPLYEVDRLELDELVKHNNELGKTLKRPRGY